MGIEWLLAGSGADCNLRTSARYATFLHRLDLELETPNTFAASTGSKQAGESSPRHRFFHFGRSHLLSKRPQYRFRFQLLLPFQPGEE